MDFVILIRVLKIPINKVSNIDNIGTIMRPLSSSDMTMEKYIYVPIFPFLVSSLLWIPFRAIPRTKKKL